MPACWTPLPQTRLQRCPRCPRMRGLCALTRQRSHLPPLLRPRQLHQWLQSHLTDHLVQRPPWRMCLRWGCWRQSTRYRAYLSASLARVLQRHSCETGSERGLHREAHPLRQVHGHFQSVQPWWRRIWSRRWHRFGTCTKLGSMLCQKRRRQPALHPRTTSRLQHLHPLQLALAAMPPCHNLLLLQLQQQTHIQPAHLCPQHQPQQQQQFLQHLKLLISRVK